MATTEDVAMSTGEVVVVKTDGESDTEDGKQAQVILQLHSMTAG